MNNTLTIIVTKKATIAKDAPEDTLKDTEVISKIEILNQGLSKEDVKEIIELLKSDSLSIVSNHKSITIEK